MAGSEEGPTAPEWREIPLAEVKRHTEADSLWVTFEGLKADLLQATGELKQATQVAQAAQIAAGGGKADGGGRKSLLSPRGLMGRSPRGKSAEREAGSGGAAAQP